MRLQKFLADHGVASRRKAEEYIQQGLVKVNGKIVNTLGSKVDPEKDEVIFDEKVLGKTSTKHIYLMLNKPAGYLSTCADTHQRKTILDLLPKEHRLFPVGRLDQETEGLLLVTDDGDLTFKLTHPKHHIEKEYQVICEGVLSPDKAKKLEEGVLIGNKKTAPAQVSIQKTGSNTTVHITIHEGRKRQIRNMFEIIGHKVHYLKRIRIGHLKLDDLPMGKYRHLSTKELDKFF